MTEAQAVEALWERGASQWATATGLAADTLIMENEAEIPPSGTFAQLSLGAVDEQPLTAGAAGSRKVETRALLMLKIWTPVNAGRSALSTLADAARTIFSGQVLTVGSDDLVILTGSMRSTATDGGFYMGLVTWPVRWYSTF